METIMIEPMDEETQRREFEAFVAEHDRRLESDKALIDVSDAPLVKIRRNGHAFWVKNMRVVEARGSVGVYLAEVANDGVPFFPIGSAVAFLESEVQEVDDRQPAPQLN